MHIGERDASRFGGGNFHSIDWELSRQLDSRRCRSAGIYYGGDIDLDQMHKLDA
jgi:hypothetical protein